MSPSTRTLLTLLTALSVAPAAPTVAFADDGGWIVLSDSKTFDGWAGPATGWAFAGGAKLDPKNPKRLVPEDGEGVMVTGGPGGRAKDLYSKRKFADLDVHAEFLIAKGSNSGVKLMGLYEIQIYDSFGVKEPSGNDCGGIYPRAEEKPKYHHIDEGFPPRVNAAKPAGEWQTLDISFTAPHFGPDGKKTANARFVKVVLNGQVIHEDRDVGTPTGANYVKPEVATGPLQLQGDHGPVAFRNVRVRPLGGADKSP
jgi:Domain of Unknown Function (DUF1080)